ncbi:MAG TPA: 30S ribosomal protein S7 [Anaerolineae bacterium]|nr:30S ribosomal protein S7 [Anaerolineae bacterium]
MSRRSRAVKREVSPDIRYNSLMVQMFINRMMLSGKKSTAQRIMYGALALVEERSKRPGLEVFEQAMKNATPQIEVKPRRVGGATYQVPVEVPADRRNTLAMRWLLGAARSRGGKSMVDRLAGELMDAASGNGAAIKKREETHKMAEANRAFAHFRW